MQSDAMSSTGIIKIDLFLEQKAAKISTNLFFFSLLVSSFKKDLEISSNFSGLLRIYEV